MSIVRKSPILWLGLGIGFLPLLWVVTQHVGPRAAVPAVDPTVAWNQRAAALSENAATHYVEAVRRLGDSWKPEFGNEVGGLDLPPPPEVLAWLEQHSDVFDAIYGAREKTCLFTWKTPDAPRSVSIPDPPAKSLFLLVRCLGLRARAAAAARDLAAFEQATDALLRMADHQEQQLYPLAIGGGLIARESWADYALLPFEWTEIPEPERAEYAAHLLSQTVNPVDMPAVIAWERDLNIWMVGASTSSIKALVVPPRRIAGEADRLLSPFVALAESTPEEQARLLRSSRVPRWPDANRSNTIWNLVAGLASYVTADTSTTLFEQGIRVLTPQRGALAAAAVWKYRLTSGTFPAGLTESSGDTFVDPYGAAAFRYRPTDSGFVLYSVGLDGYDDGGTNDSRFGRSSHDASSDGDIVIWPVQRSIQSHRTSSVDAVGPGDGKAEINNILKTGADSPAESP